MIGYLLASGGSSLSGKPDRRDVRKTCDELKCHLKGVGHESLELGFGEQPM
jgi:hypothetical protein